jgi:hypothetical protein
MNIDQEVEFQVLHEIFRSLSCKVDRNLSMNDQSIIDNQFTNELMFCVWEQICTQIKEELYASY